LRQKKWGHGSQRCVPGFPTSYYPESGWLWEASKRDGCAGRARRATAGFFRVVGRGLKPEGMRQGGD
jgi:hypothetical protein